MENAVFEMLAKINFQNTVIFNRQNQLELEIWVNSSICVTIQFDAIQLRTPLVECVVVVVVVVVVVFVVFVVVVVVVVSDVDGDCGSLYR